MAGRGGRRLPAQQGAPRTGSVQLGAGAGRPHPHAPTTSSQGLTLRVRHSSPCHPCLVLLGTSPRGGGGAALPPQLPPTFSPRPMSAQPSSPSGLCGGLAAALRHAAFLPRSRPPRCPSCPGHSSPSPRERLCTSQPPLLQKTSLDPRAGSGPRLRHLRDPTAALVSPRRNCPVTCPSFPWDRESRESGLGLFWSPLCPQRPAQGPGHCG